MKSTTFHGTILNTVLETGTQHQETKMPRPDDARDESAKTSKQLFLWGTDICRLNPEKQLIIFHSQKSKTQIYISSFHPSCSNRRLTVLHSSHFSFCLSFYYFVHKDFFYFYVDLFLFMLL